jgi:hypothetical protein
MATFTELRQLLDYRALGAVYEEYGRLGAPNPLFNSYVGDAAVEASTEAMSIIDDGGGSMDIPVVSSAGGGSVERFDTDSVEWIYLSQVKTAAPLNKRGASARVLQPTGTSSRRITMCHVFNELRLGIDSLRALRESDNWVLQRLGRTEVTKQLKDFATKHAVMKQVFLSKAMADGIVHIDANGNILESSSGAEMSIDLGVASSHKTNLGGIVATAWDNAAAKILTQLDNLKIQAEIENADPPRHVWLHGSAKAWFRDNTEIKALYSGIRPVNEMLQGEAFELGGYVFHFFSGTYTDASGSTAYFIPPTKAIITPDLGPWFMHAIGLEAIPTTIDVAGSADEALNSITEVYGDFAYAKMEHNPPRLSTFMGTNFIYGYRNPNSIWMPTVDF